MQGLWFPLSILFMVLFGIVTIGLLYIGFKYYRRGKRLDMTTYALKNLQKQIDNSPPPPFEDVVNTRPSRPTSARSYHSSSRGPSAPPLDIGAPQNPFKSQYSKPAPPPPPKNAAKPFTDLLS
jgi:hypothetical protein